MNAQQAEYRERSKHIASARYSRWYSKNKKRANEKSRRWYEENADRVAKSREDRIAKDPEGFSENRRKTARIRAQKPQERVKAAVRSSVRHAIKLGGKRGRHTFAALGYTVEELMRYLEKKFQPGMSWENYGKDGWEIDHITPLAAHNFETVDDIDFKRAWALSNLQPLWRIDNEIKGAKLTSGFQPSLLIADNDNGADNDCTKNSTRKSSK